MSRLRIYGSVFDGVTTDRMSVDGNGYVRYDDNAVMDGLVAVMTVSVTMTGGSLAIRSDRRMRRRVA